MLQLLNSCLRNAVSLFHIVEQELEWREKNGKALKYESLRKFKPIVAVGAEGPLEEQLLMADYFRKSAPSPSLE